MATNKQWDKKFIGDEISIKGRAYFVTANYPKYGYLLAAPCKVLDKQTASTLKLKYA